MIENKYNELSKTIIVAAIEVHRTLGPGLLELSYQKMLGTRIIYSKILH